MDEAADNNAQIEAWLKEEGYQPDQIKKILARVTEYEEQTKFLSGMDSVENSEFGINAIIAEALGKMDPPSQDE